jgi:hypothetical protein
VDLILSNASTSAVEYDPDTLSGLSDHILVMTKIHTPHFFRLQEKQHTGTKLVRYKWIDGSDLRSYTESANTWRDFTNSTDFIEGLNKLLHDSTSSNDDRAAAVEQYILK